MGVILYLCGIIFTLKKIAMSLVVEGRINKLFDEQQVSAKFRKREFVLELENGNYPEFPKFQLTQDRCLILDAYNEGDMVRVHFDLKGRPYNKPDGETIYFTNLGVWKIEPVQQQQTQPQYEEEVPHDADATTDDFVGDFGSSNKPPASSGSVDMDDLPF